MKTNTKTEKSVYFDLMLTLTALAFIGYFYYGIRVVVICLIACISCTTADFTCIKVRGKRILKEDFGNAVVTGMMLALMMPASISYNILIVTCFFAIIIGKQVFGGRENMLFSPAAVGYIFAAVSWGKKVLQYPKPYAELSMASQVSNTLYPSLSSSVNSTGVTNVTETDLMLGIFTGPIGTCCLIVLMACFLVLIFRNSIAKLTTAGILLTCGLGFFFFGDFVSFGKSFIYGMISNMVVFGAVFIASDINTTPKSALPRLIYGIFIGIITLYLTLECKLENAVIYAAVISSPLALALDDYTIRVKMQIHKFMVNRWEPFITKLKQKIHKKLTHNENISEEE